MADIVQNAQFPQDEIEKRRKDFLLAIQRQDVDWQSEVARLFKRNFFSKHPYGHDAYGTAESVRAFSREEVIKCYQRMVTPGHSALAVYGDVVLSELTGKIQQKFAAWKGSDGKLPDWPEETKPMRENLEVEVKNDKTSAALFVGTPGLTIDNPQRPTLDVLAAVISGVGYPSGRLHQALRGGDDATSAPMSASAAARLDNWISYLASAEGQSRLKPVIAVEGTTQVDLGTAVTFRILAVDGNGALKAGDFSSDTAPPSENDYSIAATVRLGMFDYWIGGDYSGQYSQSGFGYSYHDIERSVADEVLDVDVVRVNHHGSDHSNNPAFIAQLDPEVSIISVGNANTYGHPRQVVMDRLNTTSQVYMTERGAAETNIGAARVVGHVVVKTADGVSYTVNGTAFIATDPLRMDGDADGYFREADPNDSNPGVIPSPHGGCDLLYQNCQ